MCRRKAHGLGIDIEPRFVSLAEERVRDAVPGDRPMLLVGRPKYPTKDELERFAEIEAGSAGRKAEAKHKRKTYGRKLPVKEDEQASIALMLREKGSPYAT